MKKQLNEILEDNGSWLLLNISTPKFQNATMAIDADVYNSHAGGKIFPEGGYNDACIYAVYRLNKKLYRIHRDVIKCDGYDVDHINKPTINYIDNRESNLRTATKAQNQMNIGVRSNNSSGATGVTFHKGTGKWRSRIGVCGKRINLGLFESIDIAISARKQAEREYFGKFAFLNNNTGEIKC